MCIYRNTAVTGKYILHMSYAYIYKKKYFCIFCSAEDEGIYRCIAKNDAGESFVEMSLTVQGEATKLFSYGFAFCPWDVIYVYSTL